VTFPTGKLVEVGSCPESHEHIRALLKELGYDDKVYEVEPEVITAARKFLEENGSPQMCIFSTVEQLRDAKVMPLLQEVVVVPKAVWEKKHDAKALSSALSKELEKGAWGMIDPVLFEMIADGEDVDHSDARALIDVISSALKSL
jgi:hypothetical protein